MRTSDRTNDRSLPFISVVMPVRNEAASIERTLGGLIAQDYDPTRWEILVVDGESNDDTVELAAQVAQNHSVVRVFNNPRRLSSAARNVGVRNAKGDIVVVIDGHCEIDDRSYLRELADAFARSGADCVGRPQPLDVSQASALQRAIAAARSSRLGHHPDSYIYATQEGIVPAKSVAVAYRRSVFDKIGCFDERFDACEDVEFNHRIDQSGLRCFFTPEVAVRYVPRASLSGLFHQMMRYGRGRVRLFRKHPATLSLGILLPFLLTVGVVGGLPLCLASHWLAAVYTAAVVAYVAVVLIGSASIALRLRNGRLFLLLPAVFFAVHFGAGFGMLRELFVPGRLAVAETQPTWPQSCSPGRS